MKHPPLLWARHAQSVGETWARETVQLIHAEQRLAAGGFPGTLTEARSRVLVAVIPWLAARGRPSAKTQELESMARAVYQAAKTAWSTLREPEGKEPLDPA